jgi:hypothetical protein
MQLLDEDINEVGHILARRFFTEQGWKFTDLARSGRKIAESLAFCGKEHSYDHHLE